MKKELRVFLCALALVLAVMLWPQGPALPPGLTFAQGSPTSGVLPDSGTVAPASCSAPQIFFQTGASGSGAGLYYCNGGTFSKLGAAGSLPSGLSFSLPTLTISSAGNGNGVLALSGNTSGVATCTAPAIAGTSTNQVVCTNVYGAATGTAGAPTWSFSAFPTSGFFADSTVGPAVTSGGIEVMAWDGFGPKVLSTQRYAWSSTGAFNGAVDTQLTRPAAGVVSFDTNTGGNGLGTSKAGLYSTTANCASGASPAVCAAAASGSVAVPAGTNSTLQVNTTAVTANSIILLQADDTLSTKLSVTCNSTIAALAVEPIITGRTGGSNFTITETGTTVTNPACFSYFILN